VTCQKMAKMKKSMRKKTEGAPGLSRSWWLMPKPLSIFVDYSLHTLSISF